MPLFYRADRESDAKQQRAIRDAMARNLEILRRATPDTFLGRKTQEPFPQEDEEYKARWMASKELRSPK